MPAREIVYADAYPIPYDEYLLERARTQWQFGDWESLAKLDRESLQHHPDRAKLALLAAAGHLQRGNSQAARQFTRLARDWGCGKKLVSQILIAGVHNSLGRASAIAGQQPRALQHFENAVAIGTPGCEVRLVTQARTLGQRIQLGLEADPTGDLVLSAGRNARLHITEPETLPLCPEWLYHLVEDCLSANDVHDRIDAAIASHDLSPTEYFFFFISIAEHFKKQKDTLTATHFLSSAQQHGDKLPSALRIVLVKKLVEVDAADMAVDVLFKDSLATCPESALGNREKSAIQKSYNKFRASFLARTEHGHKVLLAYVGKHLAQLRAAIGARQPVFVEIGSTRESVPGQSSTSKIAEFCKRHGIHFITVDMDSHNSRMAESTFKNLKCQFEAVNKKGEDYLREVNGPLDFVFLDAYDFDHGKHSLLRQSRYEKFLGAHISDTECHKMHFDCAQSVAKKLSLHGLVCIDDTWLEGGKWTAKGTLAVPYLLENGFQLLEARNRAALLERK